MYTKTVVTYQSPNGYKTTLCSACARRMANNWPRDPHGDEYCSVSVGKHFGECCRCMAPPTPGQEYYSD